MMTMLDIDRKSSLVKTNLSSVLDRNTGSFHPETFLSPRNVVEYPYFYLELS